MKVRSILYWRTSTVVGSASALTADLHNLTDTTLLSDDRRARYLGKRASRRLGLLYRIRLACCCGS